MKFLNEVFDLFLLTLRNRIQIKMQSFCTLSKLNWKIYESSKSFDEGIHKINEL